MFLKILKVMKICIPQCFCRIQLIVGCHPGLDGHRTNAAQLLALIQRNALNDETVSIIPSLTPSNLVCLLLGLRYHENTLSVFNTFYSLFSKVDQIIDYRSQYSPSMNLSSPSRYFSNIQTALG